MAVDTDMPNFPALEADFMVTGVVAGEGSIIVTVGPLDFGASDSDLLFLDQRGQ